MRTNVDKEAKLKETMMLNTQLKNEARALALKMKDIECELTKMRNESDYERAKKMEGEA